MEPRTIKTGPYDSDFDGDGLLSPTKDERMWAMVAHLSAFATFVLPSFGQIVGPLVVWLVKRDSSAFVADQAKEALNFQITITLAFVAAGILAFVLIGIPMLVVLGLAWLVLTVVGGVRANEGVRYRYPLTVRFVK
ncbi:DUF4870 domain-containing protein [Rubrivirga sp. S365]|uniref:DUF4870 domain-containing protein n=1 Tax=Rubrivirga litoralis TaxID=3075598 RepID=A0ABU3BSI2_9BACT|nr:MULTISPECIES: DUF4870 domain-containing protein [unclassified Rubrivirga]MDT0632121.1 DUF4870 domain-containing protein [Rubrivirga sp. F394]MDT7856199.1 DUF4870 domain-containing protein [Rubrivirga sp. S365]